MATTIWRQQCRFGVWPPRLVSLYVLSCRAWLPVLVALGRWVMILRWPASASCTWIVVGVLVGAWDFVVMETLVFCGRKKGSAAVDDE